MKIYVDGLPKSCLECPCFNRCGCAYKKIICSVGECSADYSRDEDCPLQSLADHDKQVRKEVLDELCNMLEDRAELIDFGGVAEFMITTYDLIQSVKQIQGEDDVKDYRYRKV